jgi:pimeloyl-ACP methyl ester carboxylesterase
VRADLLQRYSDSERGRHSIDHYLRPFTSSGGHRVLMRHLMALDEGETAELSAALSNLARPVALVSGADDRFVPPALARRLHSALPHATLDILNDVRHFTPEEAPERVANVLDDLLKR